MGSFIGDYTCKADGKGRVTVPVSFRKAMLQQQQSVFVLRKNLYEPCLDMYPYSEWEKLMEGVRAKLSMFDRDQAAFMRGWYRGTLEVEMDGNGRILLPRRMIDEVGGERGLVLAGQDTKIEVWGEEAYARSVMDPDELGALAGRVFETVKRDDV